MSLDITFIDKEIVSQNNPTLRALQEVVIYLSEQPAMTKELRELSKALIAETNTAKTEVEFLELERSIRELLFRLEHTNQQNDIGREALLRRILKSVFDIYKNEDTRATPFEQRLETIGDRFLRVVGLAELDTLRQDALDLMQEIAAWKHDEEQNLFNTLRELAVQAIQGLIIQDSRYNDHNAKVDKIVEQLQNADSSSLDDLSAQIQDVLVSQNNIFLHYRIERLELQQIILSTSSSLKSFADTNEMLKEALAQYISMMGRKDNNISPEQFQNEILQKTALIQSSISHVKENLKTLQDRINQSHHRISLPEIELAQSQSKDTADLPGESAFQGNATFDSEQRFEQEIKMAVEIFIRHRTPYCLCMIRLGNMNKIKDEFGLQIRGKIINHITAFLKSELRKIDLLFHIADDQFGVILPNTTTRGAYLVMERIFLSIEAKQFIFQQKTIRVPVNIGICDLTPEMSESRWLKATLKAASEAEKIPGVRVKTFVGENAVNY